MAGCPPKIAARTCASSSPSTRSFVTTIGVRPQVSPHAPSESHQTRTVSAWRSRIGSQGQCAGVLEATPVVEVHEDEVPARRSIPPTSQYQAVQTRKSEGKSPAHQTTFPLSRRSFPLAPAKNRSLLPLAQRCSL